MELFRFLDWVLGLPKPLTLQFNQFLHEYEEKKKMPYITSIERMGIEKGHQEGRQEAVIDILQTRFKRVPKTLIKTVQNLDDLSFLSKLLKEAVLVDSLKTFKQMVALKQ